MDTRGTVAGSVAGPAAGTIGADAPTRSGSTRWARAVGWSLIVACLGLVVVGLVAGERTTSYEHLRHAIASGEVEQVTVSRELTGDFRGQETVDVYWRTGLGWRVAEVVEQHPLRRERINGLPVVYDVTEDLTAQNPGLDVEVRPHWRDRTTESEVLGWRLPGWGGLVVFGIWVAVLMLIVGGAPPWRATRWAWFWLFLLAAPVGVVAFLLFGGPCGLRPPPPGRRPGLTGGLGFLLALAIGAAIGTVGG